MAYVFPIVAVFEWIDFKALIWSDLGSSWLVGPTGREVITYSKYAVY
jgi:hypothetical protein